jgi:succinate dehydrogenase / fumarate reductase iron-sulfur subunit
MADGEAPATEVRPALLVELRVRRQDGPETSQSRRWERFRVACEPRATVTDALREVQRNPVTTDGSEVAPVAFEASCLDGTCGACTLLVNGRVALGCTTLVEQASPKGRPIVLAPLGKFPVVRDLVVDRSRMFDDLKLAKAWVALDGTHDAGAAPRQSPEEQRRLYPLSGCMACGACLEACPEYGEHSEFMGATALNEVRRYNAHPVGRQSHTERLEGVMRKGGVADCGKAQNCVEVCPAGIPLVDSIQELSRDASRHLIVRWLLG